MRTPEQAEASRARLELWKAGKNKPCAVCGRTYPGYIMEYHHVKDRVVARKLGFGLTRYCKGTRIDEINNCIAVCGNCHKTIHYEAMQATGYEERERRMAEQWKVEKTERKAQKKLRRAEIKENQKKRNEAMRGQWEAAAEDRQKKDAADILALVPAAGTISKNDLLTAAQAAGIGRNKAWACINALIKSGALVVHRVPRSGTSARIDLARLSQF